MPLGLSATQRVACGRLCLTHSSPWVGVSPESWGGNACPRVPPLPPGSSPPGVARHRACARAGLSAPSPRDALGVLGLAHPPFPHPPSGLGWAAPASRRVPGPQTAGPVHPSPSPSQAPGACQVVRLPVTLLGSSSLPGKAAERLEGRGRRPPSSGSAAPRLSTLGPAVPEGVSGPGPASEAIWGPPGVWVGSRSRSGPWAETRRLLSRWFGPGSQNECNTPDYLWLLLINK